MASIELKELTFRYPGADEETLSPISLKIENGEAFALLGGALDIIVTIAEDTVEIFDDVGSAVVRVTQKTNDLASANRNISGLSVKLSEAIFEEANLSGAIWIDGRTCALGSVGTCN